MEKIICLIFAAIVLFGLVLIIKDLIYGTKETYELKNGNKIIFICHPFFGTSIKCEYNWSNPEIKKQIKAANDLADYLESKGENITRL